MVPFTVLELLKKFTCGLNFAPSIRIRVKPGLFRSPQDWGDTPPYFLIGIRYMPLKLGAQILYNIGNNLLKNIFADVISNFLQKGGGRINPPTPAPPT